jgi:hypothetical protein
MKLRIQIATVHGAVRECGDVDFPGIFIRLDDPKIWNFISSIFDNPTIPGDYRTKFVLRYQFQTI